MAIPFSLFSKVKAHPHCGADQFGFAATINIVDS